MKIPGLLGASALALAACSSEPTPLPDSAAQLATTLPSSSSSAVGYQKPFAGYQGYVPSGPASWRAANDKQSEAN
ncbi:hypothetical protein QO034_14525 [Sedimentitalea sp. JM2-8]|uniref:Lipoprotein n=1 Tax=Sedimentitalea xiamensis TaxID=3050037 RepID=A0ABT7FGQ0_9RHOB|nr:hypothetical protein [Sedimentitalea xiamensis]MDK3074319.1 hypothetical protein [Sedimentitalea xiamensis]